MFTKEDYEKYFDQIARIERRMICGAYDLGYEVDDPSVTRALEKIGGDEVRHYGYVLKMLKSVTEARQSEKRREVREYYLGTIRLRSSQDQTPEEAKAYCVNLSKTGICLESAQAFSVGGFWDLEIRLFGKDEGISRGGSVIWSKEVEPGLHISGIGFER